LSDLDLKERKGELERVGEGERDGEREGETLVSDLRERGRTQK
jgi:hypothetical protein